MNRRSFLARCLSGAVLGMARVLPMPELPKLPRLADGEVPFYETDWGMVTISHHRFDTIIMDDILSDPTPLDRAAMKGWFDNVKMPPGSKLIVFGTP